jgi:hypothetical protein
MVDGFLKDCVRVDSQLRYDVIMSVHACVLYILLEHSTKGYLEHHTNSCYILPIQCLYYKYAVPLLCYTAFANPIPVH